MLLKISKFFLYISVFCVVIVMTSTFFPFIGGKDYFFRISVELALIFFLLWWAFEAGPGEAVARLKEISSKPIFIAVSLFVLAILLSTIFAYDPHAAFWSNYERGEGAFQILHYYVFFALLAALFKNGDDWARIFKLSLVAASLLIAYGVFAQLGWADNFISPYQGGPPPDTLWSKLIVARFQGSLGNPAYVAPYLIFSMFYAFYLWANNKLKNRWLARFGYGAIIAAFLFFFALTETRGAFLGLGAGILFFLAYLAFTRVAWRKWLLAAIVVFVLAASFLIRERHSDFVKNLPGGRLFDIATSDQTVQTRFWTWGSAFKGFKDRPLLGWGLENFSTVFDKYFDPRHFVPGKNTETWFDRAHSIYFDYLAETGILGLASYLGIFAAVYWMFFRKTAAGAGKVQDHSDKKSADAKGDRHQPALVKAMIFSLPIAYLVQGLAIFDVLPIYTNLFLFFAFANYYLGAGGEYSESQR